MHRQFHSVFLLTLYQLRSVSADACDNNNCLNGATCQLNQTDTSKYICDCAAGYEGTSCEFDIDECASNPCDNNATCVDLVNDYRCDCRLGYSGTFCETRDYWTLQQWTGNACEGPPWRCFRLQMDKCIDTGFTDGNVPKRKNWFGKLSYNKDTLKYELGLCWGGSDDDEESCTCDNHYPNIPRLGKNSFGPVSEPGATDSDRCHKLLRVTSSRLVNSSGAGLEKPEEERYIDCGSIRPSGLLAITLIVSTFLFEALRF